MSSCLICRSTSDLTTEHIIPQTLWRRLGLDPNSNAGDIPKTRTTLCDRCNNAGSGLHNRPEMMELLEMGVDVNQKKLSQLADWAFWVLLLLGLAQGGGVFPEDLARSLLLGRFVDKTSASMPKGTRVYAGLASSLESDVSSGAPSYSVIRIGDEVAIRDDNGKIIGFQATVGQALQVAQSIGIGSVVLLVIAPTERSGNGHEAQLDAAVSQVGLSRIHPMPQPLPHFVKRTYNLDAVRDLFVSPPSGTDASLLPAEARVALQAFRS